MKIEKGSGRRHWLVWLLVVLQVVSMSSGLALQAKTGITMSGMDGTRLGLSFVVLLGWSVSGALIITRRQGHPIGWIFLLFPLPVALNSLAVGYAGYGLIYAPGSLPAAEAPLLWLAVSAEALSVAFFSLLLLLFPDGQYLSGRWRTVGWITVANLVIRLALGPWKPGKIYAATGFPDLDNPFAAKDALWSVLGPLDSLSLMASVALLVVAAAGLLLRFRRSRGDERQQLKWLLYVAVVPALADAVVNVGVVVAREDLVDLGFTIVLASAYLFAAAVSIAIFRYRLYEVDILINRTLVYGVLTAVLALLYLGSVALLQGALGALAGEESPLAVVISTLFIAAMFAPLRRRIQALIDRRFYRRKYDAARALATVGVTARDEVDLRRLEENLLALIQETLQPAQLSLWLRPELGVRIVRNDLETMGH